jgi:hypothetical protein
MKKVMVGVVFMTVALLALASCSMDQRVVPTQSAPVAQQSPQQAPEQAHIHEFAARGRVPAHHTTAPDRATLAPTLSPALFTGNIRLAYEAAQEIPQTLAQLPCYCHCDRGHGHKSLHSCFESEHGENSGICNGEALNARNLQKQGMDVSKIRKEIIAAYGSD